MQLLLSNSAQDTLAASLQVANDTEVSALDLSQVSAIALHFPKFTDGRAYSQAHYLRVRAGFGGALIAWGDVLVDQLPQMRRLGFSHALLRDDQSLDVAQSVLAQFTAFYQGDVHEPDPIFIREQSDIAAVVGDTA